MIFLNLVLAFSMLTGAYFQLNNGNVATAVKLQTAGGAFSFITCIFGWWIFAAIMLASLDFPFSLPGKYHGLGVCEAESS
jgi:succinate-acetate transporter protein